ncbi:MAG: competence/damage-inducible protein A [Bacillota bacterium]
MKADLICVGNEILTGLIENTNAGFLSRRLWSHGIIVREAIVVADDRDPIGEALKRGLGKSEIVIITGGLGPTDDDLTREAVASVLDLPLFLDQYWLKQIEHFFKQRGITMPENNRKQAKLVKGSKLLPNPAGTAPGAILEHKGCLIVMLPGPPNELKAIYDQAVKPFLNDYNRGKVSKLKTLKCAGIGESRLEEKIKSLGEWDLPPLSYVARGLEVHLQLKGEGDPKTAAETIEIAEKKLRDLLGNCIFGSDDETLAGKVAELINEQRATLAVAESCSGGLLSSMITDIPGSSNFYKGGLATYTEAAKRTILNIDEELLNKEGAVSEKTTLQMAENARKILGATIGLAVTGIAGPGSDRTGKPVGLVYIALADQHGSRYKELNLGGGRPAIKERASQAALNMLRKSLLNYKRGGK